MTTRRNEIATTSNTVATTTATTSTTTTNSKKEKNRSLTFPLKLHKLLCEASENGHEDVISWLPDGRSFKVHDRTKFANEIMPTFLGSSKFRSFQKNLNMWKFSSNTSRTENCSPRRGKGAVDQDDDAADSVSPTRTTGAKTATLTTIKTKGACFHPLFIRNAPSLCHRMIRQPVYSRQQKCLKLLEECAYEDKNNKHEAEKSGYSDKKKRISVQRSSSSRQQDGEKHHRHLTHQAPTGVQGDAKNAMLLEASNTSCTRPPIRETLDEDHQGGWSTKSSPLAGCTGHQGFPITSAIRKSKHPRGGSSNNNSHLDSGEVLQEIDHQAGHDSSVLDVFGKAMLHSRKQQQELVIQEMLLQQKKTNNKVSLGAEAVLGGGLLSSLDVAVQEEEILPGRSPMCTSGSNGIPGLLLSAGAPPLLSSRLSIPQQEAQQQQQYTRSVELLLLASSSASSLRRMQEQRFSLSLSDLVNLRHQEQLSHRLREQEQASRRNHDIAALVADLGRLRRATTMVAMGTNSPSF